MAQAARLSRRMQKEVRLLVEDPPHGTSFPSLSDLSSLDALIEGPEGTVYAGGAFKIRVQIPDRYPFQPPNVTFATPIYHPNIDTGGRICLDILNLPPKGGWQPSLNISTVLTSIRLLLSEPNPDDGLMCEASKEFKYDRQAFDRKARFMTEKYAGAGLSCDKVDGHMRQPDSSLIKMEDDENRRKLLEKLEDDETASTKIGGIRRKLSLACSSTTVNKHNAVNDPSLDVSFLENHGDKSPTGGSQRDQKTKSAYGEPHGMRQTVPSESIDELPEEPSYDEHNVAPRRKPIDSLCCSSLEKSTEAKRRGLSLGVNGRTTRPPEENEENLCPNVLTNSSPSAQKLDSRKSAEKHGNLVNEEVGESPTPDAVIVLDSEDSDKETNALYVGRKLLGRKCIGHLRSKTRRIK